VFLKLNDYIIVNYICWALGDYTGNAFSNDSLILTPFNLLNFQLNNLIIDGSSLQLPQPPDKIYPFEIVGQVDTVYLIPEPATILLFGLGYLFLRKRK
jgi:hypothetical protein